MKKWTVGLLGLIVGSVLLIGMMIVITAFDGKECPNEEWDSLWKWWKSL